MVADTSFHGQHPDKLESVDLAVLLELRDEPVHLVITILVIDELDNLKRSRGQEVRWRPAYTLAYLDRILNDRGDGTIRPADTSALHGGPGTPRGQVTVEILPDPPGHRRLPINDDELIDRALAVQALAGRSVTVLT